MHPTSTKIPAAAGDEPLSLAVIATAVLRSWRLMLILPLALAVAGGASALMRARAYQASASIMQKGAEGRMEGGAAALAQQFGLNLGGQGAADSPQFFAELLRSRALLRSAVESRYEIQTPEGPFAGTLIEYWGLDKAGGPVAPWLRSVDELRDRIDAVSSRETGLVQFTVDADHPALAEQITRRMLDLLNDFNIEIRQSRAEEEGRFAAGRMQEAQAQLRSAEGALQDFLRRNRQYRNSPELSFEHDRLERNVRMWQEVYTSLLRSREQSRIDALRDMPLFNVIDSPEGSAAPQPRGTVIRTIVGFLLGALIAVIVAIIGELRRRNRNANAADRLEIQDTANQVWQEMRNPGMWLRRKGNR